MLNPSGAFGLEAWEWRVRARCRDEDSSLFFHPDGERGQARKRRQQMASQICASCPVKRECREHSILFQEAFGTWGGVSEDDRSRLLGDPAVNIRTHRRQKTTPARTAIQEAVVGQSQSASSSTAETRSQASGSHR